MIPYGIAKYQHYSNLFAVSRSNPETAANGEKMFDDVGLFYIAGAEAEFTAGRQKFFAAAEGRRINYSNFSQFNHSEYRWTGGLDWALTRLVDGKLAYKKERRQVAFVDDQNRVKSQLNLEDESVFNLDANLNVSKNWRIELGGQDYRLDSPQPPLRPNFGVTETSFKTGIKYVGAANLSTGFEAISAQGKFVGLENDETIKYKQTTGQITANYKLSDRTSFNGAVGYTRRNQLQLNADNTVNATTGSLGYKRRLTGKTSFSFQLVRAINTYIYNAGATTEINTGGVAGLSWQATQKANFAFNYSLNQGKFAGGNVAPGVIGVDRSDRSKYAELLTTFNLTKWMVLAPYGRVETRKSNIDQFSYNNTVYGTELRIRFE
ncbi:MAG: hypothetical protein AB7U99_03070 [Steroidobacteraceae bacterium]